MTVGQPERATQNRVIVLLRDELGYRYLGDWSDRDGNSNIEEGLLSAWLTKNGHTQAQISVALYKLRTKGWWARASRWWRVREHRRVVPTAPC